MFLVLKLKIPRPVEKLKLCETKLPTVGEVVVKSQGVSPVMHKGPKGNQGALSL